MLQTQIDIPARQGCTLSVAPRPFYRWSLTITAGDQTQQSYHPTQVSALTWASRYATMLDAGVRVRP